MRPKSATGAVSYLGFDPDSTEEVIVKSDVRARKFSGAGVSMCYGNV